MEFATTDFIQDYNQMNEYTMSDYDDTFNILLGIRGNHYGFAFNWLDNPYISAEVYELD